MMLLSRCPRVAGAALAALCMSAGAPCCPPPQDASPSSLSPGSSVQGEITENDPQIRTEELARWIDAGPVHGTIHALTVPADGDYTIELRSRLFDAYLVLWDGEEVAKEDNDGLVAFHARVVYQLRAGRRYRVAACALHGETGAFELAVRSGQPTVPEASDRAQAELEEHELILQARENAFGPEDLRVARALDGLGEELWQQQRYDKALPIMQRALVILEKHHGKESAQAAYGLHQVAAQQTGLGNDAEAERLHREGLGIREKVLGADDPAVARSLDSLASYLETQTRYAEAEPLFRRCLAIREKTLGVDDPDLAWALNNVAWTLHGQGKYSEAEPLFRRALAVMESARGAEHRDVAWIMVNLASVLHAQGQLAAAEAASRKSLGIRERTLGPDHDEVAKGLDNLVWVLESRGNYSEAESLVRRAMAIREKTRRSVGDYASNLGALARLLRLQGRPREAEPLARRALAIQERVLGPDHLWVATHLNDLSSILRSLGKLAKAEALLRRAMAIREKRLDKDHPYIAIVVGNLATVLQLQGKYAEAEKLHRRANAIAERAYGPEHYEVAVGLSNLALLLKTQDRFAEAEALLRRSLAICEKALAPGHPQTSMALHNLALVLDAKGEYAEAEALARRAVAIAEKALGNDHESVATSLANLAEILKSQGRLVEAEELTRESLAIYEKALSPEHPYVAMSLARLSDTLEQRGNYAEAETIARRGLAIVEGIREGDHQPLAMCLSNLAMVLKAEGKYVEAEGLIERALGVSESHLGRTHTEVAACLHNLGRLLISQRRYADAEQRIREALAIDLAVHGETHPVVASTMSSLATALRLQGKLVEAEELNRRTLAIRERILGSEHPSYARTLNNLAVVLRHEGKHGEAEALYRRALAIENHVLGAESPETLLTLNNLAMLLGDLGRTSEARVLTDRRCTAGFAHVLQELALSVGSDRFRLLSRYKAGAIDLLLSIAPAPSRDEGALAAAYEHVTSWKGMVFRHVKRLNAGVIQERLAEDVEVLARLRDLVSQLGALVYAKRIVDADAHRARFEALDQEKRRLEQQILAKLGIEAEHERTSAKELGGLLPDNGAVLDFVVHRPYRFAQLADGKVVVPARWDEPRLLCFVVQHGALHPELVDLGPKKALAAAVTSYLGWLAPGLRGGPLAAQPADPKETLRKLLYQPLAAHLRGVKQLFVIADDSLAELPFGAIALEDGRWLLEACDIVYAQDAVTLRDLLRAGPPAYNDQPNLLVFGDIDYDRRGESKPLAAVVDAVAGTRGLPDFARHWSRLDYTRTEAQNLVALHGKRFGDEATRAWLFGAEATEEVVKKQAPGMAVLHLATHGFFQREGIASLWEAALAEAYEAEAPGIGAEPDDRPAPSAPPTGAEPDLLTGLIFAGANEPAPEGSDDGVLTAAEVARLDLSTCELAVLSACETALGSARSGEGLMSLRRAFAEAGAKTVISTLWKVSDKAALTLTTELYINLWEKKQPVSVALRNAKLHLLRHTEFKHPKDWAAFVLAGEWR